MFAARLKAYEPGGDALPGLLLDGISWDASLPLNDVAALTLSYPAIVDAVGLMEGPVEIGLEVSDGGDWVEPRNGRFLSSELSANAAQDLDVPSFTFRGLGALLERPFILRQQENSGKPYTSDEDDPKRNFLSATPGQIIQAVVNESRAKYPSMLQGIELGFSAGQDSLGAGWNVLESAAYSPGTDLLRLMDDLVARGLIDWWFEGRTLMVVNADSASVHHSQRLLLGDATEAPIRVTYEGMATHVALEGGQGLYKEKSVPGAVVPYGAKPIRIANDSVTTEGTATQMVDAQIASSSQPRREYTRSIADLTRGPLPLIDWLVGDWVQAENWQGTYEEVRAFEIGISYDSKDPMPSARVTLNDRFIDAQVRQAKRMQGITHGTTQNLGDGGIPSRVDKAVPAAPLGVTANSLGYWADTIPLSSVDVAWQAVTTSVDGLPLYGIVYYDVRVGGLTKRIETGTTAAFDGLEPSRIFEVRVRPVSSTGIVGPWSSFLEVLTAYPLDVLPPPTAPILRSENGALESVWDGDLDHPAGPGKPPLHFSHVLLEVMKVGTGTWAKYGRDQGTVLVGLTKGDTYRVRLYAVDYLGKESEPGVPSEITIASAAQTALDDLLVTKEDVLAAQQKADKAEADAASAAQAASDANTAAGAAAQAAVDEAHAAEQAAKVYADTQAAAAKAEAEATAAADALQKALQAQADAEAAAALYADQQVGEAATAAALDAQEKANAARIAAEAAAASDAQTKANQARIDAETAAALDAKNKADAAQAAAEAKAALAQTAADNAAQVAADAAEAALQADQKAQNAASAAAAAQTTADGANARLFRDWGAVFPTTRINSTPLKQGDELVTRKDGQSVQVQVWNGVSWADSYLLAGQIFVLSTDGTISLGEGVVDAPQVKAGALDAFEITSPVFQSVSAANRGIKWNGSTFIGYNASGAETFRLDATRATITGGTIQTTSTANRGIKITSAGVQGWDSTGEQIIRLTNDPSENLIVGRLYSNIPGKPGMIWMNSTTAGDLPAIFFSSDGSAAGSEAALFVDTNYGLNIRGRSVGGIRANPVIHGITVPSGSRANFLYNAHNEGALIGGNAGKNSAMGYVRAGEITSRAGEMWLLNAPTSTAGANALISLSPAGRIYRSTSLAAAKVDIQNVHATPAAILNVPVRDWYDKGQVEGQAEAYERQMLVKEGAAIRDSTFSTSPLRRIPGVVAEEVLAAGLAEFCTWDENGDLQGVMYDRLPLLLIPLVKEMRQEIDELKEQLNAQR